MPSSEVAYLADTSAVLHYDADYELIAFVTRQPHEWVARRGSL